MTTDTETHDGQGFTIEVLGVNKIARSPYNRTSFPDAAMAQLMESMRDHGLHDEIHVRAVTGRADGLRYELIAGERRLRAAKALGWQAIRCKVRSGVCDEEARFLVLEHQLSQDDWKPSEKGAAIAAMYEQRDEATGARLYTLAEIAQRLHCDVKRVSEWMALARVPFELSAAIDEGRVALALAELVARLPDADQRRKATSELLRPTGQTDPMTYQQGSHWMQEHYARSLRGAPFAKDDDGIVPAVKCPETGRLLHGGACSRCPANTATHAEEQGRGKSGVCLHVPCFAEKVRRTGVTAREEARQKGMNIIEPKEAAAIYSRQDNKLLITSGYVDLEDHADPALHGHADEAQMPSWFDLLNQAKATVKTFFVIHPFKGTKHTLALAEECHQVLMPKSTPVVAKAEKESVVYEGEAGEATKADDDGSTWDSAAAAKQTAENAEMERRRKSEVCERILAVLPALTSRRSMAMLMGELVTGDAEALLLRVMGAESLTELQAEVETGTAIPAVCLAVAALCAVQAKLRPAAWALLKEEMVWLTAQAVGDVTTHQEPEQEPDPEPNNAEPTPMREQAWQLYLKTGSIKAVIEEFQLSENTVKTWHKRDGWRAKREALTASNSEEVAA